MLSPPPPPPPMAPKASFQVAPTTEDGRNALLSDIRNGPRLRSVPKPKEKNIFVINNDHNNNNGDSHNDVAINGMPSQHTEDKAPHRNNPLVNELQAELTDTLKKRKNHVEDEKAGVRTFDPNIFNSHKPQPTGLKIGHATPNFKVNSVSKTFLAAESKPPPLPETPPPKISSPPATMKATRAAPEIPSVKKSTTEAPPVKKPTPLVLPEAFKRPSEPVNKPPIPVFAKEKSPGVVEKQKELVRVTSMDYSLTPKPLVVSEETFEREPEGIRPELLSPKSEVKFQIGSAKAEIVEMSNSDLRSELDRPDPTTEFDIKQLVSAMKPPAKKPLDFHREAMKGEDAEQSSANIKNLIQRLNSEDSGHTKTLPRAARATNVKTNSLSRGQNGLPAATGLRIGHAKPNFSIQTMTRKPLSPQSSLHSSRSQSLSRETTPSRENTPEPYYFGLQKTKTSVSREDISKTDTPEAPKVFKTTVLREDIQTHKPEVTKINIPEAPKVLKTSVSRETTPKREAPRPDFPRKETSVTENGVPKVEKQTSTLFRTQASLETSAHPSSPPPVPVKKSTLTSAKSVTLSKKAPAPKPPLTPTLSSPTSPHAKNQSALFSHYHQTLSKQKNGHLHDSGIDVNFETKQQISFSKELTNAPNNYKEVAKTSETHIKTDEVFFGGVNLRGLKLDIDTDRNSVVRVVPK